MFDPWFGKIAWSRAWQPTLAFLPGKSPWTEEPGELQSMGSHRVIHDLGTEHTHAHIHTCTQTLIHLALTTQRERNLAREIKQQD